MSQAIKIGVSACVLGEKVDYAGEHARDPYISEIIGKYVQFVPLCPELACGMGVPREPVRLVDCAGDVRLIGEHSAEDWSDRMAGWIERALPGLDEEGVDGFVLKSGSPTCALMRGKIHSTTGSRSKKGAGFFARRLVEMRPLLPVEASERLQNPILRENFIRKIFVLRRWRDLQAKGKQIGRLVDFHTRHKMLIRAHDLRGYRQMNHLLGESSVFNTDEIFDTYGVLLFKSLSLKATPKKNADVLRHAMGFFKNDIDSEDKQELMNAINSYKAGKSPLLIPVTLINHHARKHDKPYLTQQFFLNPDPSELKLLNHV